MEIYSKQIILQYALKMREKIYPLGPSFIFYLLSSKYDCEQCSDRSQVIIAHSVQIGHKLLLHTVFRSVTSYYCTQCSHRVKVIIAHSVQIVYKLLLHTVFRSGTSYHCTQCSDRLQVIIARSVNIG